jgi:hypothetical protein
VFIIAMGNAKGSRALGREIHSRHNSTALQRRPADYTDSICDSYMADANPERRIERIRRRGEKAGGAIDLDGLQDVADAACGGREARGDEQSTQPPPAGRSWPPAPNDLRAWGRVQAFSQPSICRLADGLPPGLVRDRRRALKAYGNAVVPAVAYWIGRRVMELDRTLTPRGRVG